MSRLLFSTNLRCIARNRRRRVGVLSLENGVQRTIPQGLPYRVLLEVLDILRAHPRVAALVAKQPEPRQLFRW